MLRIRVILFLIKFLVSAPIVYAIGYDLQIINNKNLDITLIIVITNTTVKDYILASKNLVKNV
jgi:hypothetical protein